MEPTRLQLRNELIMEAVNACVQGMGDMDMTPMEALVAAEIVLWTFFENGLKLCPNEELVQQSKLQASRVLNRLAARVEAWPAKTTERM